MDKSAQDLALEILESLESTYSGPDNIVQADEKDFAHLDFKQYAKAQADLDQLGFRKLGDFEARNLSEDPSFIFKPVLIRSMVSSRGDIVASVYQVCPRPKWVLSNVLGDVFALRWINAVITLVSLGKAKFVVDYESELSDGSFVVTSSSKDAGAFDWDMLDEQRFDYGTNAAILFHAHCARLSRRWRANALSITLVRDREDHLAMQARLKKIKNANRVATGWISREELVGLANGDVDRANTVYDEIQMLVQRQGFASGSQTTRAG